MPTRVKICGITRWEDAKRSVELGAAALGFNFYPPSPRYITPAAACDIILRLPPLITAVGIFVDDPDEERIAQTAQEAGVPALQIHGPRLPAMTGVLKGFTRIRAVAVREGFRPEALSGLDADAILLDAFDDKLQGGTGKPFNWAMAQGANRYATIFLAGGLTPENVNQAIREVRPFAVDVASGVEAAPGVKDAHKLRTFFQAVAQADRGIEDGD